MSWQRKKRIEGKNKNYSLSRKLRREQRSSDEFEVMLNSLSLEEVIGLKLELASKVVNGKLYGMPLWRNLRNIVQDAAFKYAYSAARTQGEAMRLLGLQKAEFQKLVKKYSVTTYFSEKTLDKEAIIR